MSPCRMPIYISDVEDARFGHLAEPKFPLAQVAAATEIKVTAHDLRRTFISRLRAECLELVSRFIKREPE